ncbi:replicative DNA helicase [Acinetobacter towneri]|uniref:replicative DNA helicase n=1 Tax=Acinetobacter towneri TaxID=202956 RepID=UPI0020970C25|nr:replicative DNA helicase [Acinetobacter towneri]MCO8058084.1 replicative DNA helicase [Acinetobacter towneri]MCO8063730.1 replicative DNA helicase [Acinetobacter towneri]
MSELYSIPVEQAVLSSLMDHEQGSGDHIEQLTESDFYATRHQVIFHHIKNQHSKGEAHDSLVIWEMIRRNAQDAQHCTEEYFLELTSTIARFGLLGTHVKKLKDLAVRRKIQDLSKTITTIAKDTESYTSETAIEKVQALAAGLDGKVTQNETCSVGDVSKDVLESIIDRHQKLHAGIEVKVGVKTGFTELDNKLDRIDRTDLVIIGARPSMGKTTLAQNIMLDLAVNQGEVVLFMSGEMSKEQIMERMISGVGQISLKKVRSALFDEADAGCIYQAVKTIQQCPIFINDKASPSLADIRREARKVKQKTGGRLNAIVVDYLQIMTPPEKSGNKVQEIGGISWGLKKIAKDFECPVFALSQLNRSLEQRPNKRPVMSDIRESGAIEQDADIIMFIYRDEVYHKESKDAGVAEIIIGKARNGSTGTVRLATDLSKASFSDLSPEYYSHMEGL